MAAKIDRIETFVIHYPVAGRFKFFESSDGKSFARPAVMVKITADNGVVGWGQSVPTPRWSYETVETVESTIRGYLAPELQGQDPFDGDAIAERMNRAIAPSFSTGQPICKAGVDLALFDLTGKIAGQSAFDRWGIREKNHVELSWTLNPRRLEDIEANVEEAKILGYAHFNMKVAPDAAFDLEMCRAVRRLLPDACLWVDANGGYDESTALEVAPKFAELGMVAFEQPLKANRLTGYARLKKQGAIPILMDEGIVSVTELREFHQLNLLDGAAIKVARCGGLRDAVRQAQYLREHGLLFFGSGLTDPDLSLAASVLLFSAFGLPYPAALNGPQYLTESILKQPLAVVEGKVAAPGGPGLGVEIDETNLTRLR